jgi:uncharacterized protein YciI
LFEDDPAAPSDIRQSHMPAHLAFLEANATKVSAAGPLATPSGANAGGLWMVEADSAAEVERLVHADPFWPTGLRRSFSVLKWTQVFVSEAKRISLP